MITFEGLELFKFKNKCTEETMLVLSNKPVEFIPESQKEEEKPVKFKVMPPTRETMMKLQALMQETISEQLAEGKGLDEIDSYSLAISNMTKANPILIDTCVIGWENVFTKDEEGNLVEMEFNIENLQYLIDQEILEELVNFIDSLSKVDEKNE